MSAEQRKAQAVHRIIQAKLGPQYSWDGELWYYGHPLSESWQSETERKAIAQAERNWHEATTA
jgi:hypothetical protein